MIKRSKELQWTSHAHAKMRQYRLSKQRVRRVIHTPKRIEEGIAPDTVAMMQPSSAPSELRKGRPSHESGKPNWKQEIWVMIQDKSDKRTVISAWRYPGITKPGQSLPEEIIRELRNSFDN